MSNIIIIWFFVAGSLFRFVIQPDKFDTGLNAKEQPEVKVLQASAEKNIIIDQNVYRYVDRKAGKLSISNRYNLKVFFIKSKMYKIW